jgi:mitochondrial import receptor subunit TOM40
MTSPSFSQKDGSLDLPAPAPSEQPRPKSAYFTAISPLTNAWNRYSDWRSSFGLPNPGTAEQLQKEVKGDLFSLINTFLDANLILCHLATLATNFLFEGGRADLTKSLSANPAFQVTHSFALGSQASPSSYNFAAIFANDNVR